MNGAYLGASPHQLESGFGITCSPHIVYSASDIITNMILENDVRYMIYFFSNHQPLSRLLLKINDLLQVLDLNSALPGFRSPSPRQSGRGGTPGWICLDVWITLW
jgi:hypothetical protein